MTKNKKAAMEMSVGTIVTIVLLMTVLVLGLILIRSIFSSATKSIDSIDSQVTAEINNLFSSENKDLVVSLGSGHSADVSQGTRAFGFVFGYSPDDPTALIAGNCNYAISADTSGTYCSDYTSGREVEEWITTGINQVVFSERQKNAGYSLVRLNIPESTPICTQRYLIAVSCEGAELSSTWFDINVVKKGVF